MSTCTSCGTEYSVWTSSVGSSVCNSCRDRQKAERLAVPPLVAKPSGGVLLFACGLMAGFFMPWIQLFGAGVSGYQIGRFGSYGNYAWIIPVLAGVTIATSLAKMPNRAIGALTGLIPLGALIYAIARLSDQAGTRVSGQIFESAQQVVSVGGYVTLVCCVGLLFAAVFSSPSPANDTISQLERIANLREKGVISDAEFEDRKRQILQ